MARESSFDVRKVPAAVIEEILERRKELREKFSEADLSDEEIGWIIGGRMRKEIEAKAQRIDVVCPDCSKPTTIIGDPRGTWRCGCTPHNERRMADCRVSA